MNTDSIEIECPACGKTIHSHVEICPFCCSELEFHDMDDLEKVANGHDLNEKACTPSEPIVVVKKSESAASEPETSPKEERAGRLGKLFGRGKK